MNILEAAFYFAVIHTLLNLPNKKAYNMRNKYVKHYVLLDHHDYVLHNQGRN